MSHQALRHPPREVRAPGASALRRHRRAERAHHDAGRADVAGGRGPLPRRPKRFREAGRAGRRGTGCCCGSRASGNDPKVPAGPHRRAGAAGRARRSRRQRSVRVWVSLGPRRLTVPRGRRRERCARRALTPRAGAGAGRRASSRCDDARRGGHDPAAAPARRARRDARPPKASSLLVSRGPGDRDYVMPDLIGRDAPTPCSSRCERAGLKVDRRALPHLPRRGARASCCARRPPPGHRVSPQTRGQPRRQQGRRHDPRPVDPRPPTSAAWPSRSRAAERGGAGARPRRRDGRPLRAQHHARARRS